MASPPVPENDAERLLALRRYEVLDTRPEEAFDRIARLAARMLHAPSALVSFADEHRQWTKARFGLDIAEVPREHAFCTYAILAGKVFCVLDAALDPRFHNNPFVTGAPHIRFYAGAPLITQDVHRVGALCVIDPAPRARFSEEEGECLAELAAIAVDELDLRLARREMAAQLAAHRRAEEELRRAQAQTTAAERRAREAHDRLKQAVEVLPEGFLLFDPDDRLILCNGKLRDIDAERADVFVPGARFETILRESVARGLYADIAGREEEWIAERIADHREAHSSRELLFANGRWVRVEERRMPDGCVVGMRIDITDLKAREASFKLLFDANPLPMWVFDRETLRFLEVNQAAIEHYGFSREQFLAMTIADIRPPEDVERLHRALQGEHASRGSQHVWRHRRADGSLIDVQIVGHLLKFCGRPAEIIAAIDVTEARRAAERVRRSEERYRLLAEHASDVIMHSVLNGPRLYVSPSVRQLLGYDPDELVPGTGFDLLHPEDVERVRSAIAGLTPDGPSALLEYRARHKDGGSVWVEATIRLMSGAEGRLEVIGALRDIRERKRAQEDLAAINRRLLEENRRFDIALENTRHGLAFYDAEWRLQVWNRRYADMFGFAPGALRSGMTLTDVMRASIASGNYPEAEAEAVIAERLRIASIAVPHTSYVRLKDDRVIEALQQPLAEGGRVMTFTDITEQRRHEARLRSAKEEAEAANRTKSEFLANMSHELRTPLNAILGFSEMIQRALKGPVAPCYRDYAQAIHQSGQHLLGIINDVLDISKIEAGRLELRQETVDLVEGLWTCVRLMSERARNGGVALLVETPPDAPMILGDPVRLKQILLNLLSNAVKFTPSGGRVTVSLAVKPGNGVVVSVGDTGIGMRSEDVALALEPFSQVDGALNRKYEGTGLGLPLAKRLTELHGGTLAIDSAYGRGTTVRVWLPETCVVSSAARAAPGS